MNLNEAYNIIRITPEEVNSIKKYLGFKHTAINILGDLDPSSYERIKTAGWLLPEFNEELKELIQDFVNVYSAMYKTALEQKAPSNLIRGTSNKQASNMNIATLQFLSTSTDENTAKTFCEYDDAALVHFNVAKGVPFLNAEDYRDVNSANEHEVILAPFCKIVHKTILKSSDGYSSYKMDVEKPNLEEKTTQELSSLYEQVVSGFSQNLQDISEYLSLLNRVAYLDNLYEHEENLDEKNSIAETRRQSFENGVALSAKASNFKTKLQSLLRGLCKQKELEINKANDVLEEDRQNKIAQMEKQKAEEQARLEAAKQEENRKTLIASLSESMAQFPINSSSLEFLVTKCYTDIISSEKTYLNLAKRLGIKCTLPSSSELTPYFERIKSNLGDIQAKLAKATIHETDSAKTVNELSSTLKPSLDGIAYGLELANDMPDLVTMYQKQCENTIKRSLYLKVQNAIKIARLNKYAQEKRAVLAKKPGILGKLTGKEHLKNLQLQNIDFKIRILQNSTPSELDYYSIKDMLSDIYAITFVEFDKTLPPELELLYETIKGNFGKDKDTSFSDKDIYELAQDKIQSLSNECNLPAISEKKPKFFGKTKAKIASLDFENRKLHDELVQNPSNKGFVPKVKENAYSLIAQKFKIIAKSITLTASKDEPSKAHENTLDLF